MRAEKDQLEAKDIFTLRPNVRFEQLTPDDDNAIVAVFHKDNYEDAVEFCLFLLLNGCVVYFNWTKTECLDKVGNEFFDKVNVVTYKNFPDESFSWKLNKDKTEYYYTLVISDQHVNAVNAILDTGGEILDGMKTMAGKKIYIRFFDTDDYLFDDVINDCMGNILTIRNLTEL